MSEYPYSHVPESLQPAAEYIEGLLPDLFEAYLVAARARRDLDQAITVGVETDLLRRESKRAYLNVHKARAALFQALDSFRDASRQEVKVECDRLPEDHYVACTGGESTPVRPRISEAEHAYNPQAMKIWYRGYHAARGEHPPEFAPSETY